MNTTETVIYSSYDRQWKCNLDVTLIEYADGSAALHRLDSVQYNEAMREVAGELDERGYVRLVDTPVVKPTGVYMKVKRKPRKIRTTLYLHGDKDAMYDKGLELGLTGKALDTFAYALYEVTIPVLVDEATGEYEIIKDEVKG